MTTKRKRILWWIVGLSLLLSVPAIAVIGAIKVNGIQVASQASTPCTSGSGCLWWDGNTTGPVWHKADNTNVTLGAGGGGSMAIGSAVASSTAKSILYIDVSSNLAQDNANLAWDYTNHRLGIGTNAPLTTLDVKSTVTGTEPRINVNSTATDAGLIGLQFSNAATFKGGVFRLKSTDAISIWNPTGAVITFDTAGNATPIGDNASDLGASGTRYRNVYALALQSGASSLTLKSSIADSGTAVANILDTANSFTATGDKLVSFRTAGVEKASIDHAGNYIGSAVGYLYNPTDTTSSLNWPNGSNLWVNFGGVTKYQLQAASFLPWNDNSSGLGDAAHRWTGVYGVAIVGNNFQSVNQAVSWSTATPSALAPASGEQIIATLSINVTAWSIAAGGPREHIVVVFVQDATGNRTLAGAASNIKLASALTLSTGAGKRDTVAFDYDGINWIEAFRSLNN